MERDYVRDGLFVAGLMVPKLPTAVVVWLATTQGYTKLLARVSKKYHTTLHVLVTMLASSVNLGNYLFCPEYNHSGYQKFLVKHGNITKKVRDEIHERDDKTFGQVVHPGQSSLGFAATYWCENFVLALKLYGKFFALTNLGHMLHKLVTTYKLHLPKPAKFLSTLLRSSVFLATYCTIALCGNCVQQVCVTGFSEKLGRAITSLSGLALLLERPSRRPKLASYIASFAVLSGILRCKAWIKQHQLDNEVFTRAVPRTLAAAVFAISATPFVKQVLRKDKTRSLQTPINHWLG